MTDPEDKLALLRLSADQSRARVAVEVLKFVEEWDDHTHKLRELAVEYLTEYLSSLPGGRDRDPEDEDHDP